MNTKPSCPAPERGALAVSLVTTVLNDLAGTRSFLTQMARQTRPPNEIVVVDAGSKDGTWDFLQSEVAGGRPWQLIVLQEAGCNIARGRNLAIQAACHELIVSTDIGCHWDPDWIAELIEPMRSDLACEAVMGSWRVRWEDQQTPWAMADPLLRGELEFRALTTSHASSRAIAYRKALWQRIGGYPEDLTLAADDMVFVLLLHKASDGVAAAPIPRCIWDRPQTFKSLIIEARRNFRGSAEAGIGLDYFILAGGRILFEWLCIGLLALAVLTGAAPVVWLGFAAFVSALFVWRARSWLGFWRIIRQRGGRVSLWQVVALDYATRVWALRGYLAGLRHGSKNCQECRRRVRNAAISWW